MPPPSEPRVQYLDPADEIRQALQVIACDGALLAERLAIAGMLPGDVAEALQGIAQAAERIRGVCERGIAWRKP